MKKLLNKEMGFMAGVIVYLLVLITSSQSLMPASKAMPLAICVLCMALIVIKALLTIIKRDQAKPHAEENTSGETKPSKIGSGNSIAGLWQNEVTHRTIVFIFWLVAFSLSVQFIGFLVTTAVGLMVLFITTSKITAVKSTIITAGTLIFVYLLFIYFLDVRFPSALLF